VTAATTRALARAVASATRCAEPMAQLAHRGEDPDLPLYLRRQINAVVEEFDLLRHLLREETLLRVIAKEGA
jgi:uncharacterized protein (UPF0147 family)